MKTCPICAMEYDVAVCPVCGYDQSRDYERYPTLGSVPQGSPSRAGLQADYEASLHRDECPCCGRHVEGKYCGFCGFHMSEILGIRSAAQVEALGAAHRENFLGDLKDISLVNYHYQWDPETSRLEFHHADERRLADGRDCHPGIFWSGPLFGQLDTNDYPDLELTLSYRWRGRLGSCKVTVPTVRTDDFWRVGLLLDAQLRLQVFLGSPTKFSVSQPVMLDLN